MTDLLQEKTGQTDWAGVVSRYHLYPEIVASGGIRQAASRLASRVSVTQSADPKDGSASVRIDYEGSDRRVVVGVLDAVTGSLTGSAATPSAASLPGKANLDPLYAPVVLPAGRAAAKHSETRQGQSAAPRQQASTADPELVRRLHASLAEGMNLQVAFDQNAFALNQLHQQLEEERARQAAPPPVAAPKKAPEDPQLERLHQQLIQEQRTLVDLESRYTDQYPDVVAARERVHDLQIDTSRIAAIDASSAKQQPAAPPRAPQRQAPDPQLIASQVKQLNQAETARETLQQALLGNHDQTARLRTQIELQKNATKTGIANGPNSAAQDPDTQPVSAAPPASQPVSDSSAQSMSSPSPVAGGAASPGTPVFLAQRVTVETSPFLFGFPLCLIFGLSLGAIAALSAAWLTEQRDPSIRNERMLRRVLPTSAVYLGGIPRIRHEVVVE